MNWIPDTARRFADSTGLLTAMVIVGACLRLLWHYLGPASDTPDTAVLIASGDSLFATGQMSSTLYMPLYPIVLHLFGYWGTIWLQLLLSAATVLLVYRLALNVWRDHTAALVSAALCAVHPVLVYYANLHLNETIFIFLLLLGLHLLYRTKIFAASIVLVLANLVRPSLDVILPLIVVASVYAAAKSPPLSRVAKDVAIYLMVYVALMTPWWLHNYVLYGQFVRLNLAGGITAILENNKKFEVSKFDWSVDPPWVAFGAIPDPVARDEAMKRAAIDYVWHHPLAWLLNSVDRFVRFITPWPSPTASLIQKVICAAAIIPFLLGAIASLAMLRTRWRKMIPILLPIVFLTALHVATHSSMRYRLPIDPLLIVLACAPLAYGMSILRRLFLLGISRK